MARRGAELAPGDTGCERAKEKSLCQSHPRMTNVRGGRHWLINALSEAAVKW